MGCKCNEPCAPDVYMCSCERACWIGPPEEYASCISNCESEGCDFPSVPGLPSRGYRCVDPVVAYDDCIDLCDTDYLDATTLCSDNLTACIDSCASDISCIEGCVSTHCTCETEALRVQSNCNYDCDIDVGLSAWFDCAEAEITADAECCDTILGNCYQVCDIQYLNDVDTIEQTWFQCMKDLWNTELSTPELVDGNCITNRDVSSSCCDAARYLSLAPYDKTLRICRAECERDEIEREDLSERKKSRCGGKYHVCGETCGADFDNAKGTCANTYFLCICAATTDSDVITCQKNYHTCIAPKILDNINCRFNCCKDEHHHTRNEHRYGQCYLNCYNTYYTNLIQCEKNRLDCRLACGDSSCDAACDLTYETCKQNLRTIFQTCISQNCSSIKRDCPNCGREAVEDANNDNGEDYYYGGDADIGEDGLPVPPGLT